MNGKGISGDEGVLSILAAALSVEEFGIGFYHRFNECVRDEKGAALLRGLARDEVQHKEHVLREMRRIAPGTDPSTVRPSMSLLGVAPEIAFRFPPDSCLALEDEIAAMETGINVEVNSIEMYRNAVVMVEDVGAKALLERLTHIEEGHRELLEKNLDLLRDEGAWYGYSPILEG
ncbi:MAG: ferritin family protein [Methanomassiliicoccales archaeon]|nr:ferritin family protein [Methanomassiliicoccales archaeon]